jgi:hypothetical protein
VISPARFSASSWAHSARSWARLVCASAFGPGSFQLGLEAAGELFGQGAVRGGRLVAGGRQGSIRRGACGFELGSQLGGGALGVVPAGVGFLHRNPGRLLDFADRVIGVALLFVELLGVASLKGSHKSGDSGKLVLGNQTARSQH